MDGDTPEDRLDIIQPVIEDWHALQSFLKVYLTFAVCTLYAEYSFIINILAADMEVPVPK